jgi:superfamily II DNA or RNA helicase
VPTTGAGYAHPFRRYQQLALDAFESGRAVGRKRCYVVMPPGSGKTVVGLEIARRLGRKTVIFGPNTAIQSQWVAQWLGFRPSEPAGTSTSLKASLSALTYQSLCTLDNDADLDELSGANGMSHEPAGDELVAESVGDPAAGPSGRRRARDAAAERRRKRRLIVNGGDREALLALLHPNGRKLIGRMKGETEVTLVLDECHHLLETWGHLVQAVVDELGEGVFVVGLTATPPSEMGIRAEELYLSLFGKADFSVITPAVVKEGELAPYQELAYLTEPLPSELEYMASQSRRFEALIGDLMNPTFASRPFLDWIHQRAVERGVRGGAQVSWGRFEQDEPDLALAVLRLFLARELALPSGAHVGERHRQPLTSDDWVAMIEDFARNFLARSDRPEDALAWDRIRHALPSVGYVLTQQGIRSYVSPSDRVLALSASKGVAAQTILDLEHQQLGGDLRALVLCDYERTGVELLAELRSVLDAQAGSASLILQLLAADPATAALSPMLLSGRSVACSRRTATNFVVWAAAQAPAVAAALAALPFGSSSRAGGRRPSQSHDWSEVVLIAPEDTWWQPRNYVPLVTRYFEEGRSQCLVGTRGLLGEGWDARSVNVIVDLTAASTATSVHQMRGRSLRLDPRLPRKVADNWDVVCVAPEDARGTADYARFVRKHQNYFALTATGEIECGVSHVDPALSPFGPPPRGDVSALNQRTLARISNREAAYEEWQVGRPYSNVETQTVRVHFNRSLGLSGRAIPNGSVIGSRSGAVGVRQIGVAAGAAALIGASAGQAAGLAGPAGLGAGLLVGLARTVYALVDLSGRVREARPSDSLESIASAIVVALAETGGIDRGMSPANLRIVIQPDGYYRCYLDGASRIHSILFAESLDQVLAPIEGARYIIGRRYSDPPASAGQRLGLALRCLTGRQGGRLIYHALPEYLAVRRERVRAFERAWRDYVGGTRALFYRDPEAVGIAAVAGGENPFATTSQMRTLWS